MKFVLAILLPAALLLGQTQTREKETPQPYTISEAYEVYSAILADESERSRSTKLVIAQETRKFEMCLKPADRESNMTLEPAIADYNEQNRKPLLLQWNLQIDMPYTLVPQSVLDAFFRKGGSGWEGFRKSYPQSESWISLSAVGFNLDRTLAIVYITRDHGPMGGNGVLKVLKIEDGQWKPFGGMGCGQSWAS
jgi:hypothetical protein